MQVKPLTAAFGVSSDPEIIVYLTKLLLGVTGCYDDSE